MLYELQFYSGVTNFDIFFKELRSVSSMSYRDKWFYFDGPARVRPKSYVNNLATGKKIKEEAKKRKLETQVFDGLQGICPNFVLVVSTLGIN